MARAGFFFLLLNGERAFHAFCAMTADGAVIGKTSGFIGDELNLACFAPIDGFSGGLVAVYDEIVKTFVIPEDDFHTGSFFDLNRIGCE